MLMGGTAHTQTELAKAVGRAPSSVSEHLAVLLDEGLVVTEAQGRHRYVRLADRHVAELLESMGSRPGAAPPLPRLPADLAFARSCYGHLAGSLGVAVFEGLRDRGVLGDDDGRLVVTEAGRAWFGELGVVPDRTPAADARACLDWSQRRHHLAGRYGDALLTRMIELDWLARRSARPRVLRLTERGRVELPATLCIEVPLP